MDHHHTGHGHSHHHGPADYNRAFLIGIALNTVFVLLEAAYGIIGHSLALLADAGHNLSDVLALVLAWAASLLARRIPTERRTYGYRRFSVLAALLNALFLLVAIGVIVWEAVGRFRDPAPVTGQTVIWVAAVGIAVNAATAILFMSGRKGDLNIRGAFLHMAADAFVSVGVVIAGILISYTGWLWIDPLSSLIVAVVIFIGTWRLLVESVDLALDTVPGSIDAAAVKAYLGSLPGVLGVHDLHIWGMSTTEAALTAHLVVNDRAGQDGMLRKIAKELHERFNIGHATIQMETEAYICGLSPDDIV
ncbi:cation transporter [Paenibacillus sp. HN-1]|nr:cation transporter [Paenibacillus sp. CGMCC 1.18879]MBY9085103.1 cation transporter [Paenibacillus sinensis]